MTKQDFQLIAKVLAQLEAREDCDNRAVRIAETLFANALAAEHPRFNRGAFAVAALPEHSAALRASILKQVGS